MNTPLDPKVITMLANVATLFFWFFVAILVVKVLESVAIYYLKRRGSHDTEKEFRETAIGALRAVGHNKTSATSKVDAAIKQLGHKATLEDVVRNALARSVIHA